MRMKVGFLLFQWRKKRFGSCEVIFWQYFSPVEFPALGIFFPKRKIDQIKRQNVIWFNKSEQQKKSFDLIWLNKAEKFLIWLRANNVSDYKAWFSSNRNCAITFI